MHSLIGQGPQLARIKLQSWHASTSVTLMACFDSFMWLAQRPLACMLMLAPFPNAISSTHAISSTQEDLVKTPAAAPSAADVHLKAAAQLHGAHSHGASLLTTLHLHAILLLLSCCERSRQQGGGAQGGRQCRAVCLRHSWPPPYPTFRARVLWVRCTTVPLAKHTCAQGMNDTCMAGVQGAMSSAPLCTRRP